MLMTRLVSKEQLLVDRVASTGRWERSVWFVEAITIRDLCLGRSDFQKNLSLSQLDRHSRNKVQLDLCFAAF